MCISLMNQSVSISDGIGDKFFVVPEPLRSAGRYT